ncbi:MAG: hypothetical protein FWD72_00770 [Eggerthellaceae bacterium]|nr:hypothetical protein [Eggerthellaceae bacterium]
MSVGTLFAEPADTTGEAPDGQSAATEASGEPEQPPEEQPAVSDPLEDPAQPPDEQPAEEQPATQAPNTGAISGFLWVDGNGMLPTDWNGKQDDGEQPLAGCTVYLYTADDKATPIAQTATDWAGNYSFEELEPGSYVVGIATCTINSTEYLLPMSVTSASVFTVDWGTYPLTAFSAVIDIDDGVQVADINAGMRLPMGIRPLAGTYTVMQGGSYLATTTGFYDAMGIVNTTDTGSQEFTIIVGADDGGISAPANNPVGLRELKTLTITSTDGNIFKLTKGGPGIFLALSAKLILKNITLDGNFNGNPTSGGISLNGYSELIMDSGATLQNFSAAGNASVAPHLGGAVYVGYGKFTMNDGSKILNCIASNSNNDIGKGGAIYVYGSAGFEANVTLNSGSLISGCVANTGTNEAYGGAVYVGNYSSLTVNDGAVITGNKASTYITPNGKAIAGGGVYVAAQGLLFVDGGTITNNSTSPRGYGGGIFTENYNYNDPVPTTAYMNISISASSTVSGNTSGATRIPPSNAADFATRTSTATDPTTNLTYTMSFDGQLLDNDNINYNNTNYRILYKANGGTGADYLQSSTTATIPAVTVTTAGFTGPLTAPNFVRWNTAADGTGTNYNAGANITMSGYFLILYAQWQPGYTSLTVSKEVSGSFADTTKSFTFTIKIFDEKGQPLTGGYKFTGISIVAGVDPPADGVLAFTGGSASITLKHGQGIKIQGIRQDYTVEVIEDEDSNYVASYTSGNGVSGTSFGGGHGAIYDNDTGIQDMITDRVISFTNTRQDVVPTGVAMADTSNEALLLVALAFAATLMALVVAGKALMRRKGGEPTWRTR